MNYIIAFVLPSILGLKIFMHFIKDKKALDLIIGYLLFFLFSNFFAMIVVCIVNKEITDLVACISSSLLFTVKYTTLMIVANTVLPIAAIIINKYITFDIEVENDRKSKKRKSIENN